jgi:hypothetical protein
LERTVMVLGVLAMVSGNFEDAATRLTL